MEKKMTRSLFVGLALIVFYFLSMPMAQNLLANQLIFTSWMPWWDLSRIARLGMAYTVYIGFICIGFIGLFFLILSCCMCAKDILPKRIGSYNTKIYKRRG